MKNNKALILFFIAFSMTVSSLIFGAIMVSDKQDLIQKETDHATQTYFKTYQTIYDETKKMVEVLQKGLFRLGDVENIFEALQGADAAKKDRLREKLYASLKERFLILRQSNISIVHFILPNNESFLRLHQPDFFGDDLTTKRQGIAYANTTGRFFEGYETGKRHNGFRFIFPIINQEGKHLGSMELSVEAEEFLKTIMQHYNVLCNFFIHESMLEGITPEIRDKNFKPSHHKGFYFDKKVLLALKAISNEEMAKLLPQKEITDKIFEFGAHGKLGTVYDPSIGAMITMIPILKSTTNEIAAFLTIRSYAQNIVSLENRANAIIGLVLLLLFLAHVLMYIMIQKHFASKKTAQMEARLRLAIEGSNQGLWDWDPQTNEVYFSSRWKEMLGFRDDEITSGFAQWSQRVHPEDIEKAMQDLHAHLDGKTEVYESIYRMQHKNGNWLWILDRGKALFDKEGKPIRMLGFHDDITLKKAYEENLETLVANQVKEIEKKDYLLFEQSKLAIMGEMIGAIAHQWRQPLNALGINIQNLDDDYVDGLVNIPFIQKFISENMSIIRFMSTTIDDFRNFFRIDKEKIPFNLGSAINDTASIITPQLNLESIVLHIMGDGDEIIGYKSEFQQVILNIISNAKDAILEKGIQHGEIVIVIEGRKISIEDNGGGVDEANVGRIFEPYFTTKEQGKGTGMGLYIAKTIIERNMDGKISFENNVHGAKFIIEM